MNIDETTVFLFSNLTLGVLDHKLAFKSVVEYFLLFYAMSVQKDRLK